MKFIKMLLWPIIIITGFFLFLGIYLYFSQHKMVFIPMNDLVITPDEIGLEYEDLYIEVESNEKINAWYLSCKDSIEIPDRKVVLFCHGNAGNISHRMETVEYILGLDADILLFDYRGYGKSEGTPGEAEIYQDALACYNWLINKKRYTSDRIIIFGRSLGGTVAIDLAGKVLCGGLIVESSFTSAKAIAKVMSPIFPIGLVLKYNLNSIDKISEINCPILITHSPEDDIIPYKMGEELFNAANGTKKFVKLKGGHNETSYFNSKSYRNALFEMINGDYSGW